MYHFKSSRIKPLAKKQNYREKEHEKKKWMSNNFSHFSTFAFQTLCYIYLIRIFHYIFHQGVDFLSALSEMINVKRFSVYHKKYVFHPQVIFKLGVSEGSYYIKHPTLKILICIFNSTD